jgi:polysaccharide export outer membrane protein
MNGYLQRLSWIGLVFLLLPVAVTAQEAFSITSPQQEATSPQQEAVVVAPSDRTQAPPDPTYRLGVGDVLTISVLGLEEIREHRAQVDTTGIIDLLFVGRLHVAGLTVEELGKRLTERLDHYMKNPQISVSLVEYKSQPVSVIGAVAKPGIHQLEGRKTLVEVLSLAGGLRQEAGYSVKITRQIEEAGRIPLPTAHDDPTGRFSIAEVDLPSVMEARNPEENILIRPNDVVSIPVAEMVYVIGGVKRAGAFTLGDRENISVLQAVSMANGLAEDAGTQNAKILRTSADSTVRQELPVNLKSILEGKQPDFFMQSDDILFVPTSRMKSAGKYALETALRTLTSVVIWRVR